MTGESIPLIVILGPTAVGKTTLAIELAEAIGGEIISADSRQIYRYMDIGTAKATPEQQARVPHHLIDIFDPDYNLSLAEYQTRAQIAIAETHARGRRPLLVGGTGQYITALIEGWTVPRVPPNLALRAELEALATANGHAILHQRLQALDPAAAEAINPRNVRRLIRALEVCIVTGQPFSQQRRKTPPPYRIRQYGLTMERARLYARADARLEQMMADGFLEEVRALLERGYSRELPSMSGLGYKQLAAHLLDGIPLAEAIAATASATRRFIRQQYTWFKGHDNGVLWHNSEVVRAETIIEDASHWLEAS
ncbi:MAG: tRNA (adenosine(37)-N6)-dimethylallyltransferase MiaA [Aggregatilineales bacterium]